MVQKKGETEIEPSAGRNKRETEKKAKTNKQKKREKEKPRETCTAGGGKRIKKETKNTEQKRKLEKYVVTCQLLSRVRKQTTY